VLAQKIAPVTVNAKWTDCVPVTLTTPVKHAMYQLAQWKMVVCALEMVYVKTETVNVCQDGKAVTAPLWYVKTTAADMVFAVQKNQTNASVTQDGVVLTAPSGCALMHVLSMAIATTVLVSVDKDGKVLRAKKWSAQKIVVDTVLVLTSNVYAKTHSSAQIVLSKRAQTTAPAVVNAPTVYASVLKVTVVWTVLWKHAQICVANMVNVPRPVYVHAMLVSPTEIVVSNNAQKVAVDMVLATVTVLAFATLASPEKHVILSIAQKTVKTKTVLHTVIASTAHVSVHKDGVMLIAKPLYVNHLPLAPAMGYANQKRKDHWKWNVIVTEVGMAQHVTHDTSFQTTVWLWTMVLLNASNCTPVLTVKMRNAHWTVTRRKDKVNVSTALVYVTPTGLVKAASTKHVQITAGTTVTAKKENACATKVTKVNCALSATLNMVNATSKPENANATQLKNQLHLSKVKCGLVMIAQPKVAQMIVAQKDRVLKVHASAKKDGLDQTVA
jgi:hypothetical protein